MPKCQSGLNCGNLESPPHSLQSSVAGGRSTSGLRCLILLARVSGIGQTEKQISRRRREVQIICAIGRCSATVGRPVGWHGEIVVLLQTPAGESQPIDCDRIAGMVDAKRRCAGYLHDRNECPKAVGGRLIAASHRPACIVLADGATYLIRPTCASAAANSFSTPIKLARV